MLMLGASWIGQHLSRIAASETRNRNRHGTGNDSVHLEGFSIRALAPDYGFQCSPGGVLHEGSGTRLRVSVFTWRGSP